MLHIEQIVFKLCFGFFHARAVLVFYLCPTCDSRTHIVAQVIEGNFLCQKLAEEWPLGSWPYKTHLSPKHIEQLGQFVQPVFADKTAHPSNSIVFGRRPYGSV